MAAVLRREEGIGVSPEKGVEVEYLPHRFIL
jgi:hypothetical protein